MNGPLSVAKWIVAGAAGLYLLGQLAMLAHSAVPAWGQGERYRYTLRYLPVVPTGSEFFENLRSAGIRTIVLDWDSCIAQQGDNKPTPAYEGLIFRLLERGFGVIIFTKSRRELFPDGVPDGVVIVRLPDEYTGLRRFFAGKPFAPHYREVERVSGCTTIASRQTLAYFDDKLEFCLEAVRRGWGKVVCVEPISGPIRSERLLALRLRERVLGLVVGLQRPGKEIGLGFDLLFVATGVLWLYERLGSTTQDGRQYWQEWALSLPNFLCWVRIVVTPPTVVAFVWAAAANQGHLVAVCWWSLLAIVLSDGLDGAMVRRLTRRGGQRTAAEAATGAKLDPIADKAALVAAGLGVIVLALMSEPTVASRIFLVLVGAMFMGDAALALVARLEDREVQRSGDFAHAPKAFPAGKVKMNLYGFGIMIYLATFVWPSESLLWWAVGLVLAGLPLALLSLGSHLERYVQARLAAHAQATPAAPAVTVVATTQDPAA